MIQTLTSIPHWHLPPMRAHTLAYLGAMAAVLWLMNQARRSFWLLSLLALPGTFCQEVCHWVAGRLMNGQPVRFTVIPRQEGRGYVLGSVHFANLRWYNAFFVGLAPLVMLPLAYGLFLWRLGASSAIGWPEAAMVFLLANLVFGSMPSRQDVRIAAKSSIGWLLLAGGLAWAGLEMRDSLSTSRHSAHAKHAMTTKIVRTAR